MEAKYFKNINKEVLKKNIKCAVITAKQFDLNEVMIEEYVDSHHGSMIPEIFYKIIGYDSECRVDDEWYWDEFEQVKNKVSDELQEVLELLGIKADYPEWAFNIETNDNGDLGMMIYRIEE